MAKGKSKTPVAAAEAATGTGTGAKTGTKVKEEVKVHTQLLSLLKDEDAATEKASSILVSMCELVARDNISNPVLIKTIMEARGVQESTAKSQASRIRNIMKDKVSLEALKEGKATVRAVVAATGKKRAITKESTGKKFDAAVNGLVVAAKATGQDKKTILLTVETALDQAKIK